MDTSAKAPNIVETSQRKAAKVAGIAYLFFTLGGILHYYLVEIGIVMRGDVTKVAGFVKSNELLFRLGIVGDMLIFLSSLVLALAFYTILKTVSRNIALLGLFLKFMSTIMGFISELTSFAVLLLLNGDAYLKVFDTEQLQAAVGLLLKFRPAGFNTVTLFVALGSLVFYGIFFKSKRIPRILSVWGLFTFLLLLILVLGIIIFPTAIRTMPKFFLVSYSQPMIFQIVMGIWFLIKGIKFPQTKNGDGASEGQNILF
ncbi:MAG: DUF4386 domain-containing protein [bacterium]|nr:DUF4386 domain-containing protein [bacterium]